MKDNFVVDVSLMEDLGQLEQPKKLSKIERIKEFLTAVWIMAIM